MFVWLKIVNWSKPFIIYKDQSRADYVKYWQQSGGSWVSTRCQTLITVPGTSASTSALMVTRNFWCSVSMNWKFYWCTTTHSSLRLPIISQTGRSKTLFSDPSSWPQCPPLIQGGWVHLWFACIVNVINVTKKIYVTFYKVEQSNLIQQRVIFLWKTLAGKN